MVDGVYKVETAREVGLWKEDERGWDLLKSSVFSLERKSRGEIARVRRIGQTFIAIGLLPGVCFKEAGQRYGYGAIGKFQ